MALNISGARARFRYRAVVRQTVPSHPAAIAARRAHVYLPGNPHPEQAVAAVSVVTLSYHIAQAGCVCVALKLIRNDHGRRDVHADKLGVSCLRVVRWCAGYAPKGDRDSAMPARSGHLTDASGSSGCVGLYLAVSRLQCPVDARAVPECNTSLDLSRSRAHGSNACRRNSSSAHWHAAKLARATCRCTWVASCSAAFGPGRAAHNL